MCVNNFMVTILILNITFVVLYSHRQWRSVHLGQEQDWFTRHQLKDGPVLPIKGM